MNELDSPFIIDLSDLIFDEKYLQLKNQKFNNHNLSENESFYEIENFSREKEKRYKKIIHDRKKEKMKIKNKDLVSINEKGQQPSIIKESHKEKLIDSFFNKIDGFNSLNFMLDEEIKRVKTVERPNKDFKEIKDTNEDDKFMEDFFSPIKNMNENNLEKEQSNYKNEKEKNKKKIKNGDYNNFSNRDFKEDKQKDPKEKLSSNNYFINKSSHHHKKYEDHNKDNRREYNYNKDQDKNIKHKHKESKNQHKDKEPDKEKFKDSTDFFLKNENTHLMKNSSSNITDDKNNTHKNQFKNSNKNSILSSLLPIPPKNNNEIKDKTKILNENSNTQVAFPTPKTNGNKSSNREILEYNNFKQSDKSQLISTSYTNGQVKIHLPKSSHENYLNIPLCNTNQLFLSELKEKLNSILEHNRNSNKNSSYIQALSKDHSTDLNPSNESNTYPNNYNKNLFFSFYQKSLEDPLLQKHLFIHPSLRLRFLKTYPVHKKLISKDFLYNILNGEVKNVYGKIQENNIPNKFIYYIRLLKDKDVDEIYTKIFVTEKILKIKLNKREICVDFLTNNLNELSIMDN